MARYKKRKVKKGKGILAVVMAALIIVSAILLINSVKPEETPEAPEDNGQALIPEPEPEPISYEERVGKDYKIDITPYLDFIEPEDKYEYVYLVNPANPLSEDYVPEDLRDCGHTRKDGRATQKLREYAAESLKAFLSEAKEYGFDDITVTSAYRSYAYQDYLFNMYFQQDWATGKYKTKEECEKHTLTYSTKPGTSEHQSGLCLDMHNHPSATDAFGGTEEANWLEENCYRFGFILRYPKGKTDITGIKYEPWHFRFVGREAATEMHELGVTLEEYVELKKNEMANA